MAEPTPRSARAWLQRLDISDSGAWDDVVARAGLEGDETDRGALDKVLAAMSTAQDPIVRLCGQSLAIRLHSYDLLAVVTPVTGQSAVPASPIPEQRATSDTDRLRALSRYDLDNPELRTRLDAITRRTCHVLGISTSLVSMVLDSSQLIAGSHGLEGWYADGLPVEWSFCARAVSTKAPYVVPDTAVDPLQRDNPLVVVDGLGAYAGVPLITSTGQVIGAHCVVDSGPRIFTDEQIAQLTSAADEILAVLEEYLVAD